jgi:hypothetical protein
MSNKQIQPNLSFIQDPWQIIIKKIYDFDLLNFKSFEELEIINIEYFTQDMLTLRRNDKKYDIEVGSYYENYPSYTLTIVVNNFEQHNEDSWINPHDKPLEKITFYKFSDLEEYLIKMMEKYSH